MPKYEVRLRSQTDEQSRVVTLSADAEDEATAVCVMAERERVAYAVDSDPYLSDDDAECLRGHPAPAPLKQHDPARRVLQVAATVSGVIRPRLR